MYYNDNMQSQAANMGMSEPQSTMPGPSAPTVTMPNAYAHGGRIKRGKMVMGHFNAKELDEMDHLQGKVEKCPRTGMRSYSHLEELLKNPHILSSVHHHARSHHAAGGQPQDYHNQNLNQIASHGVHGDTELALIGPHTHHVFNKLAAPGTVTNHEDGRPQYWSLGGALSGLWNTVKGGAQAAAPYIGALGKAVLPGAMGAISSAASNRFGPMGGAVANGLGGLASQGLDKLSNMGSEQSRGMANTAAEGVQSALAARQQGASPYQSAGAGLSQLGSRFGGGVGGGLQGLGNSMQRNESYGDTAKQTGLGAYQGAGGAQNIMNQGRSMLSQYANGSNPRQIAQQSGQNAMNSIRGSVPTMSSMRNQDESRELPFYGQ